MVTLIVFEAKGENYFTFCVDDETLQRIEREHQEFGVKEILRVTKEWDSSFRLGDLVKKAEEESKKLGVELPQRLLAIT